MPRALRGRMLARATALSFLLAWSMVGSLVAPPPLAGGPAPFPFIVPEPGPPSDGTDPTAHGEDPPAAAATPDETPPPSRSGFDAARTQAEPPRPQPATAAPIPATSTTQRDSGEPALPPPGNRPALASPADADATAMSPPSAGSQPERPPTASSAVDHARDARPGPPAAPAVFPSMDNVLIARGNGAAEEAFALEWTPVLAISVTGLTLAIFFIVAALVILVSGVRIVQPYEQGLWIVLGRYRHKLNSGFNWVYPLISQVVKLDLRTQVLDVPRQEVITKDNSPTNIDAIIYIKVIDPEKAFFEVSNFKLATIALAQTTLRSVIGDMELDEVLYNRHTINLRLRDLLDEATDGWGVKVEAVEIREVDPVGPVKAAMEEQTSAERRRRAAILLADGEKRSAILKAEGDKKGRILQAEGVRQSKILEAEGTRLAKILEAQGEGQALRILSLGSAPLDQKALTVLGLDALKKVGEGASTKIVLPFEVTRAFKSVSDYLGGAYETPPRPVSDGKDMERIVGRVEDVLGPIPTAEELAREKRELDKDMAAETGKAEEIAKIATSAAKAAADATEDEDPRDR